MLNSLRHIVKGISSSRSHRDFFFHARAAVVANAAGVAVLMAYIATLLLTPVGNMLLTMRGILLGSCTFHVALAGVIWLITAHVIYSWLFNRAYRSARRQHLCVHCSYCVADIPVDFCPECGWKLDWYHGISPWTDMNDG